MHWTNVSDAALFPRARKVGVNPPAPAADTRWERSAGSTPCHKRARAVGLPAISALHPTTDEAHAQALIELGHYWAIVQSGSVPRVSIHGEAPNLENLAVQRADNGPCPGSTGLDLGGIEFRDSRPEQRAEFSPRTA